jgi:hypothetical protein
MKSFVPINVEWWKHPAFWKLDAKNPRYPTMWSWLVKEASVVQRDGRLELAGEIALGPEDFAVGYHRATEEEWAEFIQFCLKLGLLTKEGDTLSIAIWKQYFNLCPSSTPENEKYRKQAQRAKKKAEEKEEERARLKAENDALKRMLKGQNGTPSKKETCLSSPDLSQSVPSDCPTGPNCPEYILDHIRSDQIIKEDKRSDNSASAENALEKKSPERPPGNPATWSAKLFKNACSAEELVEKTKRYYGKLAEACDLKPRRLTSDLQVDLLKRLDKGRWLEYADDPLVQLIAIAMGINLAASVGSAGYCDKDAVWHFALKDAENCLSGARKICDLNRDALELGEPIISDKEADLYLPTTLEKELAVAGSGNSS